MAALRPEDRGSPGERGGCGGGPERPKAARQWPVFKGERTAVRSGPARSSATGGEGREPAGSRTRDKAEFVAAVVHRGRLVTNTWEPERLFMRLAFKTAFGRSFDRDLADKAVKRLPAAGFLMRAELPLWL